MGRLEVICGPMYSGKTEELIRRIRREKIAGRTVIVYKPDIDGRHGKSRVGTHNGERIDAYPLPVDVWTFSEGVWGKNPYGFDIVAFDEVQFFDKGVLGVIEEFIQNDLKVYAAGLNATYRQEPFGIMPKLQVLADTVTRLTAVCHRCGEDAIFTQRLVDGQPAPFSGPTVQIGALESYEARCRNCFEAA